MNEAAIGSGQPAARVHRGAVRSIFDHLVLALKADPGSREPDFLLSHYRFRWAADGTIGSLAYVQHREGEDTVRRLLTDAPDLAERHAIALAPRFWAAPERLPSPALARFGQEWLGTTTVRETVETDGLDLAASWTELAPPVFAQGPAPRLPEDDIVSVLIEARAARATLNGAEVGGTPYAEDAWVGWLGRPLSSCVVALGEVLLTRETPGP